MITPVPVNPPHDCSLCTRLAAFRGENAKTYPDWFNGPVPVWGAVRARLMIVGLAPGLKGANRTGRPFTGDYAGDLLFATLLKAKLARGHYKPDGNDDLSLTGVSIANAVRCVPPQNKPTGAEIAQCRPYLIAALAQQERARVVLALGRIAHDSFLTTVGARRAAFAFGHGARHDLPNGLVMFDSYHCSRYNTNTGRLTAEMFETVVFAAARAAFKTTL